MVKRTKEPSAQGRHHEIAKGILREHDEILFEVSRIFAEAGFDVSEAPPKDNSFLGDFFADREELKKVRRYAVEIKEKLSARDANAQLQRFRNYVRGAKIPFREFDEFWVVARRLDTDARTIGRDFSRQFRILDVSELRSILAKPKPPKTKQGRAQTKIGKAVEANEKEINLAIAGLILQIDAKLEVLVGERLNSDEGKARVREEISDFERMKTELKRIREMVAAFKKDKILEREVVKATKTFRQGVEDWWSNKSAEILTSTAKGAILVSSIGLLSLMKADSVAAITAVAAVVNGGAIQKAKQIGKAVKRIAKRAFAAGDDGGIQ